MNEQVAEITDQTLDLMRDLLKVLNQHEQIACRMALALTFTMVVRKSTDAPDLDLALGDFAEEARAFDRFLMKKSEIA